MSTGRDVQPPKLPPKGTRDFLPADMALRRHVEDRWRRTAVEHGFDEIDGPTFEHLALYTVKSGDEIVSELFSFRRTGGDDDYALRPEFTPTLARMVAARGNQFAKPIRWFSIAPMFRAERPQRGRLREHIQWNCDVVGDPTPRAEAEIIAIAADVMGRLGLSPELVRIRLSHRDLVARLLHTVGGVDEANMTAALAALDRRLKLPPEAFRARCSEAGISEAGVGAYLKLAESPLPIDRLQGSPRDLLGSELAAQIGDDPSLEHLSTLSRLLEAAGLHPWCSIDFGVVRGLAYYTGTVFEIHEHSGAERAIAGGGRYDRLIELFGGPPTPAMGFAMGDVVIRLVLEDHGLLDAGETYLPRPDVFIVDLIDRPTDAFRIATTLRSTGRHVRISSRRGTNIGKQLGDASRQRARCALIIGSEFESGDVLIKDLDGGRQERVPLGDTERLLHEMLGAP